MEDDGQVRRFDSGATRDTAADKPDYEGYLSPAVIEAYGEYMLSHQFQSDGEVRASDNWQLGIPRPVFLKSMFRHLFTLWRAHRSSIHNYELMLEALNGLLFNVMGYMHELIKESQRVTDVGVFKTKFGYTPETTNKHPQGGSNE